MPKKDYTIRFKNGQIEKIDGADDISIPDVLVDMVGEAVKIACLIEVSEETVLDMVSDFYPLMEEVVAPGKELLKELDEEKE